MGSDGQYVSADHDHAILDTLIDVKDSEEKQDTAKSLNRHNRVACFATEAPVKEVCDVAEAEVGTESQLESEVVGIETLVYPQQNKMISESANTDSDVEHVSTKNSDVSLAPKLSRRKRRRKNTQYESLEEVAKSVITDPYTALGVFDSDVPSKILINPSGGPGKRKK